MFKDRWIAPTERQIKYLTGIANGSLTWTITEQKVEELYGETHENGDPKALCLMLAEEHVHALRDTRAYMAGFLDIEKVMPTGEGEWTIGVFATEHLLNIIECLKRGVHWSNVTASPDYDRTEKEWQGYLNRGAIPDEVFESANRNRDPELRKVRAALVLFKLTASKYGDMWRKTHAA